MWIVGAFKEDKLQYYASIAYSNREAAQKYCEKCIVECALTTGLDYKVVRTTE